MKTNKLFLYVVVLLTGVLLGWLLFGGSSKELTQPSQEEHQANTQMWTCSMHPQIMQPEPGDCPICGMDLIPAEAGADGLTADQFKLTDNAMALANIQTSVVGEGTGKGRTTKLSGRIVENEAANAVQVSYVSGRIERLNVNFTGETVQKGQLLATIYSPELYAAQQELLTAASLKASQPALYQAVRNKLKLWKLSEKQIDAIETSGNVQEHIPVYATVSGTVTEKLVSQGDYIKQGQPLLKIANLQTVWANFDVYENQVDLFKNGQEVMIGSNAYPNKEFQGTVDFIDPVLNSQTRTVGLRVVLNNEDKLLKPGMFVEAQIHKVAEGKTSLSIPASAVLWTGKRSVVYVKTNPNQPVFEMREVVLGNRSGDQFEVLEGLYSGNEIVSNGTFTVDAAAQLQGKKSMMNAAGGKVPTGHGGHGGLERDKESTPENEMATYKRLTVSKEFQQQLQQVYDAYIDLKNALVKEDAKYITLASKTMLNELEGVDMSLVKGNAHTQWMSLEKTLNSSALSISKSKDLKTQRDHFKYLSQQLIHTVQLFGVTEKVYVEFCPMADDNKGGYWLSKEERVINPYFGNAMLSCGEVTEIIE
ncbi:efflux RND transporter periplasmic adaptor subunit [Mangrovimonas sp. YM274]|uniref:efflux RND transporter periplasmic adaptor subunit n=1 Tax=Mangrovimonas sp. YM274 TaxID=3070660 RepID=UPI0027DEA57C|nr:efflux RND transporter periplasmic adaptor subunit [Mangrovimonas sp. YM274]WMI67751.1 efflux RND transporter periplasmic adaptor subunit [Mangrovimonas sp. YM274]